MKLLISKKRFLTIYLFIFHPVAILHIALLLCYFFAFFNGSEHFNFLAKIKLFSLFPLVELVFNFLSRINCVVFGSYVKLLSKLNTTLNKHIILNMYPKNIVHSLH